MTSTKTYTPVDPAPLSKAVTIVLFVHLAAAIANLGANALLLSRFTPTPDVQALGAAGALVGATSLLSLVVNGITAVLVLMWIYRTSANAHAFARKTLEMSPAWSVIWFFVPIASLWKPFQGVEQTWRTSKDPWNPKRVATPDVLVWWWRVFILAIVVAAYGVVFYRTRDLGEIRFGTQVRMLAIALVIPLDLMFLKIVKDLTKLQVDQIAFGAFDSASASGPAAGGAGVVHAEG